MVCNQLSYYLNILKFFILFALLTRDNVLVDGVEYTTGGEISSAGDLIDLRSFNADIDQELLEIVETTLYGYQEITDFQEKPNMTVYVVIPVTVTDTVVPDTLREIVEGKLSNAFGGSGGVRKQTVKPIEFDMQVKKREMNSVYSQTITVAFKLTDEALKCLDQLKQENDKYKSDLWCSRKMRWGSPEETGNETEDNKPSKRRMKSVKHDLSVIDMNRGNWARTLDQVIGSDSNIRKMGESTHFDINILPPRKFQRSDSLLLLERVDEVIRKHIDNMHYVKYMAFPKIHGNKIKDLNMCINIKPIDVVEEENRKFLKKMTVEELIPRLHKKYNNLPYRYETIFNAVEGDRPNPMQNSYRVVLNVFQRGGGPKIPSIVIKHEFLSIAANRKTYKYIHFTESYNNFDYKDTKKDYLILTFEIDANRIFENTSDSFQTVTENPIVPPSKQTEISRVEYPDKNDDDDQSEDFITVTPSFVRTATKNPIVPLKENDTSQQLETEIKKVKIEYSDMYDEDQYDVSIRVVKGEPDLITEEMLDAMKNLIKNYGPFKITSKTVENGNNLKIIFKVKKPKVDCYNPWTPEQKQEFFLSRMNDTTSAVVPPGCTPPEEFISIPEGGYISRKTRMKLLENIVG